MFDPSPTIPAFLKVTAAFRVGVPVMIIVNEGSNWGTNGDVFGFPKTSVTIIPSGRAGNVYRMFD
jgi:hypothetical protein